MRLSGLPYAVQKVRDRFGFEGLVGMLLFASSCMQENHATGEVIYRDRTGRQLTVAEVAHANGEVNWSIIGADHVSQKVHNLHVQARQEGSSGNYEKALDLLTEANKEAPEWPYPLYDAAFTYLLIGQSNKALELYETVNKMAPRGFFTAQTAVWSLRREKAGNLPPGTYRAYLALEWVEDPVQKKVLLQNILKESPSFSPAWKDLSNLQADDGSRLHAIEEGLSHDPDDETKGVLLINKALAVNRQGRRDEALSILSNLTLDQAVPLAVEKMAKAALANIERFR